MTHLVLVAALTLTVAAPAAAAPSSRKEQAEAEALIQEGVKLRKVGRDDAALVKFDRAYALSPTPRAAAQKGLCLQALGRWSEAEDLLAAALEGGEDPWVARNRGVIKDSLEEVKTKIGRFEISGSPEGADVTVDGRNVGRLPLAGMVRINAGPATLRVSAEGHAPQSTDLQVQGGSFRRLEFRLQPQAPAAASLPMPQPEPDESLKVNALPAQQAEAPVYKKTWFWGVVGALVVAGVVSAVLLSGGTETVGPKVDDQVGL